MSMRRSSWWVLASALAFAAASAFAQTTTTSAITSSTVQGGGDWKTDGKAVKPAQQWSISLLHSADNSLRGRISVAGSPLLDGGNVEGKIRGSAVSGTISDDSGSYIAAFRGTVGKTGMAGTYTDRTGETGSWRWAGPPPR
jgi:hypothetical protein